MAVYDDLLKNQCDPTEKARACAPSTAFNLQDLTVRAQREPGIKPIVWTFTINFKGYDQNDFPLGCFDLYELTNNRVKPSPQNPYVHKGSWPVECVIHDRKNYAHTADTATFGNGSYLTCDLKVGDWVQKIEGIRGAAAFPSGNLQRFYQNKSFDEYHNFTLFTKISAFDPAKNCALIPLVVFDPGQPSFDSAMLQLAINNAGNAFLEKCPIPGSPFYAWYDVQPAGTRWQQSYACAMNSAGLAANICSTTPRATAFSFPLQQGTLYVGHNPYINGFMNGRLEVDEVGVDPNDSKPPAVANVQAPAQDQQRGGRAENAAE